MRTAVAEMKERLKDALEEMSANAREVRNWRKELMRGDWQRREEAQKKRQR